MLLGFKSGAQVAQEQFGKNRIQFKQFKWRYLSSANFDLYYYTDSLTMARTAARYAEEEFVRIADLMSFSPYNKIRIFLYTSKADLLQSNVGLELDNSLVGGRTNFVKNMIEVAYPGSQVQFRRAIAEGVASKLCYDMLYGGSLKDVVQSSYLLLLPDWFMGGIIRYSAYGWSQDMDDELRDKFRHGLVRLPSNLLGEQAAIIGQSIWTYIAQRYGPSAVSNVLNQTRLQRDEEESIMISLGVPYSKFIRDWREWFSGQATQVSQQTDLSIQPMIFKVTDAVAKPTSIKLSPDGKHVAFAYNNNGAYKILVQHIETGKTRTLSSGGYKVLNQSADLLTPVFAWQGNQHVHLIRPHKGLVQWQRHDLEKGKVEKAYLTTVQQVTSLDVRQDAKGTHLLMSASDNGVTNLYNWTLGREKPVLLTRDIYDDLNPRWLGDTAVIFSSNRNSDSLAPKFQTIDQLVNSFDLWVLRLGRTYSLRRLTRTWYNELQPMPALTKAGWQVYTSTDQSGIINLARVEQGRILPLTDSPQDLVALDLNQDATGVVAIYRQDDHWQYASLGSAQQLTYKRLLPTTRNELLQPRLISQSKKVIGSEAAEQARLMMTEGHSILIDPQKIEESPQVAPPVLVKRFRPDNPLSPNDIDIRNYKFEFEKLQESVTQQPKPGSGLVTKKGKKVTSDAESTSPTDDLMMMARRQQTEDKALAFGPYDYRNQMSFSSVVSSLEINPITGWGIHLETNMTDPFENHKFYAGGTLFGDFTSNILFGEYQYLARHFDLKGRYDRKLFSNSTQTFSHRYVLDKFTGTISYPFTIKGAISLSPFFAQTRFTELGTGSTLTKPDVLVPYYGYRLEYVFDNTASKGLNMLQGTRFKAAIEQYQGMNDGNRSFGYLMIDGRHYQPIYNEIVFALRGSYGHSFGPSAKQFLLGGMDNWIFNNSQRSGLLDESPGGLDGKTDWLFTQYATNLRGFNYNTMSGTSYLLINAELRLPIIRAFYRGPIASNFMRHLQLTAFTDIGSSWTGRSPFTTDNSINTRVFNDGPFNITVVNYDNPFLIGYGFGARTLFLGYYLKLDLAQGIRNNRPQGWIGYLTLGYDF